LGQVKEDATVMYERDEVSREAGFQDRFRREHPTIEAGARDSSPVSELDYSDTPEMRVLKVDS